MTPEYLGLARHLVDFGLVVVLWLVQLVIYPGFLAVREDALIRWHGRYTFRVSFIIMPLMLAQLGLHVWAVARIGGWANSLALWLVGICWTLTFVVSVPLHRRISQGEGKVTTLRRLIATNWPRTFCWTAIFLLGLAGSAGSG